MRTRRRRLDLMQIAANVADMPAPRGGRLIDVLAKIRALHDFDLLMLLADIEQRGLREAVQGFGLVPKADVTSR